MLKTCLNKTKLLVVAGLLAIGPLGCAPVVTKTTPDFIEPLTSMEFIYVEGGTFKMGDHSGKMKQELPVHEVTLPGFAVGIYEVTFAQHDEFCEATDRDKPSDEGWGRGNRPVVNVSWDDANAYAAWLSKETGLNFSLPSEAQWEYFARAGSSGKYWTGRKLLKNSANCLDCGSQWDGKMTAPAGSFPPNRWGVHDTAGNVAEWTLDDFHNNYQNSPTDGSARIIEGVSRKVYRGGSWRYSSRDLKSSARDWNKKSKGYNYMGFRLILNNYVPNKEQK